MAKQVLNNNETGLIVRTKLNENFTDLYDNKEEADATILKEVAIGDTLLAPDGDGSQLVNLPVAGGGATLDEVVAMVIALG